MFRPRQPCAAIAPIRESRFEQIRMEELHGTARPEHFEFLIEREESLQQVLLCPKAKVVEDGPLWIIVRLEAATGS